MPKFGGTCLYKEARLNLEPAFPGSTVSFTLPASTTSTFGPRTRPNRTIVKEGDTDQDEDAFAKRHLASDGSIFFRRHHGYPRSFLWRILDSRKTLEIQASDIEQDPVSDCEANLTLQLHFTSPIRPFCVAFAEPQDRNALTVFVITTANELYTITLHREFFMKLRASDQDVEDWCKRSTPGLFNARVAYRLVAVSANELLISLDDGGILRLTRHGSEDDLWTEAVYQQNNWSVRNLLSWKGRHMVRFDNVDLDASAAAAMVLSPDDQHIFSVCLDHKLRAWNVSSGKLGMQLDLLGEIERLDERTTPYFIGPSQPNLMAVVDIPGPSTGALYYVVTYSPKQHQFKFWGIRDADEDDSIAGWFDTHSDVPFIPPVDDLMDATVWTLEEFHVIPGPAGWRGAELWIRARSGPSSKIYSLTFSLLDEPGELAHAWKNNWTTVNPGPLTVDCLKKNPTNPSEQDLDSLELYEWSFSEQWLDFLFYPGRFTIPTLESALLIFRKAQDRGRSARPPPRGSLKERICNTIAASVPRGPGGTINDGKYEEAVAAQWQSFYGLVKDLHKRRGETLSLVYDHELGMPWLVLSDYLSVIRRCSDPETIFLNKEILLTSKRASGPLRNALSTPDSWNVLRLLNAAASFRRNLPSSFQRQFKRQVETDLLHNRATSIIERLEVMEQDSALLEYVTDEDLAGFVDQLGMEVKDLTTETFIRAIQILGQEDQGRAMRKQITRFGINALVSVSQETLLTNQDVLLDLLALTLFMHFEPDISEEFDSAEVFVELVNQLKDYVLLNWMATTTWAHQTPNGPSTTALMKSLDETHKTSSKFPFTQTVLEGILGHRSFECSFPQGLKAEVFTYWSGVWMTLLFQDQAFDVAVEDIMAKLLFQKEFELAVDFSKFLADSNWATYLKGRMHAALGENTLASVCFQKAAYHLALGMFSVDDADTAALISGDEHNSFSSGLANYYHHILGLFEKVKAYPFVADFAKLGLRSLKGGEQEELKTELLSRLFTASIQTSRFDEAYSTLTRYSDLALKHSALQTFITSMIQQSQTATLLKFPFVGLTYEVDATLSSLCHKTLNLASGPPYHHILYSFRLSHNNFRGAASILHERLQRLRTTSSKIHDPADTSLTQCYLMIINTLSSVSKEEAYILAEQRIDDGVVPRLGIGITKKKKMLKRQIVTLETLRKEYQAELDRIAAIETGQFPFVGAVDDMDVL
ncbi:nucleoporin Nup120/160-domain-containing protein [Massariosphaeria phaeospora]|uniref:Nucleoporin Nup120/160-domain-containing protein n=1 Tax=Massariosphaeria phaeospora TaxID=100035 RepID=A0A7C8M3U1_9PLEO|nr:nucleoporin Nup120/160-domain-containing protein [Massariosphaeria phaeospora]